MLPLYAPDADKKKKKLYNPPIYYSILMPALVSSEHPNAFRFDFFRTIKTNRKFVNTPRNTKQKKLLFFFFLHSTEVVKFTVEVSELILITLSISHDSY